MAHADPKGDVQKKAKEAMESYDLMDYDAAKKALEGALAQAKKSRLDKDPVTAHVYLDLGIADFAASDQEGAKTAFAAAVKIDPKIQIDAAYKSPELQKVLDSVRGGAAPAAGGGEPDLGPEPDSGVDCKSIHGLQHEIIDTGKRGVPQPIEASLGSDVKAAKVAVMFRPEGATEFTEVKLSAAGCQYKGNIPASAMKGELIHYYVAAYDGGGKVIASKGSAGSPNILEMTGNAPKGGGAVTGDEEDPLGKHGGGSAKAKQVSQEGTVSTDGGDVTATVEGPPKKKHVLIAITGGTGFGYVTGKTEGMSEVQNCCIGSSPVVIIPELGFYLSPKTSISIAARLGFPLGANVDGHATLAPAALLRLRYAFSASGEGFRVMGQLGGGVLRNTIKLDNSMMGMDTDIVAQGPLLIGAGLGYNKRIGGSVSFIADLSVIGAIAVTDHLGSAILNNGIGADLSIGLAFGL
ncbi:MAG TPA: tetratricopeptide repeat protein [Kofleriaceae bacterium]